MKLKSFILYILISIFFSACHDDGKEVGDNKSCVSFFLSEESAEGSLARSSETNTFVKGDEIGIFCEDSNGNSLAENSRYVFDGTKFNPYNSSDAIYIDGSTLYKYYVYYPYISSALASGMSFTLPCDQRTSRSKADLMGAVNTSSAKGQTAISLSFKHKFCILFVDYSAVGKTYNSATINNMISGGTYNVRDMKWSGKGSSSVIQPFSNSSTISCILPPQDFTAGNVIGTIKFTDGTSRQINLDSDLSLKEGQSCSIKLNQMSYSYTPWSVSSLSTSGTGNINCCGTNSINLTTQAIYKRTRTTLKNGAVVSGSAIEEEKTETVTPSYSASNGFSVSASGVVTATENTTTSQRSTSVNVSYGGKSISKDVSQDANTLSSASPSTTLTSITLSNVSVTACGSVSAACTATYTTSKAAVTTKCNTIVSQSSSSTSTGSVTPSLNNITENTSTSSKQVQVNASYTAYGVTRTASATISQPGATITGGTKTRGALQSITLSGSGSIGACGGNGVSGLTCTAIYATHTTAKVTSCGTVVTPANDGTESVTVTPSYSNIAENTSTSSRTITATASYGGKTATRSVTQNAATITGGSTSWVNGSVSSSSLSFSYKRGSQSITVTLPSYKKTAVVTGCGTQISGASSGTGSVSATANNSWISVSGTGYTTITVSANEGSARDGSVTYNFSNGKTATISIHQNASEWNVDVQ